MNDTQLQRGNELKEQIIQLESYILLLENATIGVPTQGYGPVEIKVPQNHCKEVDGWLKCVTHKELSNVLGCAVMDNIANVARFMILQQLMDRLKDLKDQYEKI